MTDQQNHPTSGGRRRRRHKSAAAVPHMHDLPLPSLLDRMGADEDGPSCSEEEKETKRLRSASTTPRSERERESPDTTTKPGGKCLKTSSAASNTQDSAAGGGTHTVDSESAEESAWLGLEHHWKYILRLSTRRKQKQRRCIARCLNGNSRIA